MPFAVRAFFGVQLELEFGAVDAHLRVGDGDVEHLHGAVAQEELGRTVRVVAGEVETMEVAAGLHAERVRDADAAAAGRASLAMAGAGRWEQRHERCNGNSSEYHRSSSPCYPLHVHTTPRYANSSSNQHIITRSVL